MSSLSLKTELNPTYFVITSRSYLIDIRPTSFRPVSTPTNASATSRFGRERLREREREIILIPYMHTNTWNVVASVSPSLPRVFPVYSSSLSSSIIKPAEAAGTFAYLCQTSLQQFPVVTLTLHLLVTDSPLPLVAELSSPPRSRQVHS